MEEEAVGNRAATQLSRSWRCRHCPRTGWGRLCSSVVHQEKCASFCLTRLLELLEFFRVFPCDLLTSAIMPGNTLPISQRKDSSNSERNVRLCVEYGVTSVEDVMVSIPYNRWEQTETNYITFPGFTLDSSPGFVVETRSPHMFIMLMNKTSKGTIPFLLRINRLKKNIFWNYDIVSLIDCA